MESAAEEARRAFGVLLRDLRKDAGLKARELAREIDVHYTKVSRVENGRQSPTDAEIRAWATACGAARRIPELIATHREVDQMWIEHRRVLRGGLPYVQGRGKRLYERTGLLRVYESVVLPGIVRTRAYNTAVFDAVARLHDRPPEEADPAAEVRDQRRRLLTTPTGRNTYSFIIEAAALDNGFGGPDVMIEQLGFLLSVTRMPHVAFGVIPMTSARPIWPGPGFYLFDNDLVRSEAWTGVLASRRADEIAFHVKVFNVLRDLAVYGEAARVLIEQSRTRLQQPETS